jgi:hypothetical protein
MQAVRVWLSCKSTAFRILDPDCYPWLSGFACYSRTFRLSFYPFWGGFPGRSVIQALMSSPEGFGSVSNNPGPKPFFSEALWLNRWKNVSGFLRLTEHPGPGSIRSGFGSLDAQSRRSEHLYTINTLKQHIYITHPDTNPLNISNTSYVFIKYICKHIYILSKKRKKLNKVLRIDDYP